MPTPTIDTTHGVTAEQWSNEVFSEYLAQNPFFNFMGTSSHNIIQVKEELTKAPGDAITVQLRAKLSGAGVSGATTLKGAEEDLVFYDQRLLVDTIRHGVLLKGEMSEKRVAFDLRNQAREALVDWASDKLRKDLVTALTNTSVGRDRSRYLYGISDTNWNATHATALATVDATNDKLTTAAISRAKRKALLEGTRKVRPFVLKDGNKVEEVFVLFAHPYSVRDLLADADFKSLNTYIPTKMGDSVLVHGQRYKGMWDGVMIYETEMPVLTGAGTAGINVAHNVLCGAQAMAVAWGKRTNYKEDADDYGHQNGFAIDEIRGVSKLVFNNIDHGVVNMFNAAVAD
ncbi:MAG: N4-gp56 family major capsid protein [Blastochloris viridis]|uniref:N4-gp56 family major capsid protein n=1 Tax=Blastochloris viridis TaxID=1079 RepID=A0A6N4REE8_BLAVI|nr:MAG: N4-gp56 family major capsid protein [Blastochloris viridis]